MLHTESVIFFEQIEIDPGEFILAVTCPMGKRLKKLILNTAMILKQVNAKNQKGKSVLSIARDVIDTRTCYSTSPSNFP